jgi:hypothetical protein
MQYKKLLILKYEKTSVHEEYEEEKEKIIQEGYIRNKRGRIRERKEVKNGKKKNEK